MNGQRFSQWYLHLFTRANTTYIPHKNDRKKTQEIDFSFEHLSPTLSFLQEINTQPCESNEEKEKKGSLSTFSLVSCLPTHKTQMG